MQVNKTAGRILYISAGCEPCSHDKQASEVSMKQKHCPHQKQDRGTYQEVTKNYHFILVL